MVMTKHVGAASAVTAEGVSLQPATSGILVILAPTVELAQTVKPQISVEAEYGDTVVEGAIYTAAHHGSRSANPCPCVDTGIPYLSEGIILVSHVDLDTIGGICRAMGQDAHGNIMGNFPAFWALASFVDVNGPHKLGEWEKQDTSLPGWAMTVDALYAYWAWSQANRSPQRARDVIHDVTAEVEAHLTALAKILWEEPGTDRPYRKAGREFKEAGEALNASSFRTLTAGTIVRVSDAFVNHLYTTPSGEVAEAVVAFNSNTKAVTLSFAEKDDKRNACTIMQAAFGPTAGGHKGIAGSPRGVELAAEEAVSKVMDALAKA